MVQNSKTLKWTDHWNQLEENVNNAYHFTKKQCLKASKIEQLFKRGKTKSEACKRHISLVKLNMVKFLEILKTVTRSLLFLLKAKYTRSYALHESFFLQNWNLLTKNLLLQTFLPKEINTSRDTYC